MTRVRTALFDLDDTLFDHDFSNLRGLQAARDEYPVLSNEPLDSLQKEYSRILEELHAQVIRGRMSVSEAREERFRRIFAARGEREPKKKAKLAAEIQRKAYLAARRPVAGAAELLWALRSRDVTVGVVTNNPTSEQESKLRDCGLDALVDFLVTSEDVGEPKPGRMIFESALAQAGCRAEEAVMVGDSWEKDVLGAVGSGIRAVWFNRCGEPLPDASLASGLRSLQPVEAALGVIIREAPFVAR